MNSISTFFFVFFLNGFFFGGGFANPPVVSSYSQVVHRTHGEEIQIVRFGDFNELEPTFLRHYIVLTSQNLYGLGVPRARNQS